MKIERFVLGATLPLLFLLLGTTACDRTATPESRASPTVSNATDLGQLEVRARAGDTDAMKALQVHYFDRHEIEEYEYWNKVEAEAGTPDAIQRHAQALVRKGGPRNCEEAKQWIRKALASEATDPGMRSVLSRNLDALESPGLTQEKCR